MPLIQYVPKRFGTEAKSRIVQCNAIIREYTEQGFKLTLRQLYYQLVSRALIPNTVQSYKSLGSLVNDARLAGLIDWDAIEDRTRNLKSLSSWAGPQEIVDVCARAFRLDLWQTQPFYVEVWIEKDALVGVIEGVCEQNRVPFFACRGYTSQSEMWGAAMRFREKELAGKVVHLIHLGDHDPSGIDMTRDIQGRLRLFGSEAQVFRIALTYDQVQEYQPPPNPAKATDARYAAYAKEYGDESWELDALEPATIVRLIQKEVDERIDADKWDLLIREERQGRRELRGVSEQWSKAVEAVNPKK